KVTLHEALAATECANCLTGSRLKKLSYFRLLVGNLHAAAAAAERCLNGDGQTVLVCESLNFGSIGNWILGARSHGCFCTLSAVAGGDCDAQVRDGLWWRDHPNQPRGAQYSRNIWHLIQD